MQCQQRGTPAWRPHVAVSGCCRFRVTPLRNGVATSILVTSCQREALQQRILGGQYRQRFLLALAAARSAFNG
jgi:hypothetical protein